MQIAGILSQLYLFDTGIQFRKQSQDWAPHTLERPVNLMSLLSVTRRLLRFWVGVTYSTPSEHDSAVLHIRLPMPIG